MGAAVPFLSQHAGGGHGSSPWIGAAGPVLAALAVAAYLVGAHRERSRRGWGAWRTAAFVAGGSLIALGLSPLVDGSAADDLAWHMVQHLLLSMLGPLGLALGAPVSLLLRVLPHPAARRIGGFLRSRTARVLGHPVVALLLNSGGLVALYFTPLYALTTRHEAVHVLVHAHLVLSGLLFAWVIAGPDPAPHRPSVRARLVTLGVAVAIHASVSQLLYAGLWVRVDAPAAELRAAGSLMYFAGDIAEMLLALALLLTWRTRPPRPSPRGRRRPTVPAH